MGIICPGVQEVGHRKSGDQMSSGPNASQPFFSLFSQLSLVQPDDESYFIVTLNVRVVRTTALLLDYRGAY